jgi:hypothetical protein
LFLEKDEALRRRRRVKPSGLFQRWLYTHMMKEGFGDGLRVVTGHSHPFEHEAGFSGIDDRCMKDDQEIYRQAYGPYEFLWTVFSEKAESFEGRVIRPDGFRNVDRLVVVGEELLVFQGGKR